MNILKVIQRAFGGKSMPQFSQFFTGAFTWPDDNPDAYIDHGYKALPNVYAIISLIIQKSSIVPFEVFRVANKAKHQRYKAKLKTARTPKEIAELQLLKEVAFEKVEGSELEKLLLTPNPEQSIEALFEELDGYKLLTGNSYLWSWSPGVGQNATKPQELHVPASPSVTIRVVGEGSERSKEYKIEGIQNAIPASNMAQFKNWNPITSNDSASDALYGMSPLLGCRRLMSKYKDADISQGAMFKNGSPAGILTGGKEGTLREDQAIAIKDRYKQMYGGPSKAGEVIVTAAQASWQQIGFSPVDLNVIDGKQEMLSELCNVYHVPIAMFSSINSTDNNMDNARKVMITDAVIPLVESRKNVLNMWLAPKYGEDLIIEFDYTIFSEVQEEFGKLVDAALRMYWITPNEKRRMTNYDEISDPQMDELYFPSNLVPLNDISTEAVPIEPTIIEEEVKLRKLLSLERRKN